MMDVDIECSNSCKFNFLFMKCQCNKCSISKIKPLKEIFICYIIMYHIKNLEYEIIEHKPIDNPDFNKTIKIGLPRCKNQSLYRGCDQIILKITLPKLPNCLNYKSLCVYDLIESIEMNIGECELFKYNSEQLKIIDKVDRDKVDRDKVDRDKVDKVDRDKVDIDYERLQKVIDVKDGVVYYPINLSNMFGTSEIVIANENKYSLLKSSGVEDKLFDLSFKGIRLIDFIYHPVNIIISFGKIFDVIENITLTKEEQNILSNLSLDDVSLLCRMITQPDCRPICDNFMCQKFNRWFDEEFVLSDNTKLYHKIIIPFHLFTKISKVILYCESFDKIEFHRISKDENKCGEQYDRNEKIFYDYNTVIHDNMCVIDLNIIKQLPCQMILEVWLKEPMDEIKIQMMYKVNNIISYRGGFVAMLYSR